MITQSFYGAICMYHESAGEPLYGQRGVAHVILNRCRLRQLSVKEVIFQPKQFSCFNGGRRPPVVNYKEFIVKQRMWQMAIDERLYGFTFFDADHYHATYIDTPHWAKDMEFICQVGLHKFYRAGY